MKISVIGIDIAKSVFHLVAINRAGKIIKKKMLKRAEFLSYFVQHEPVFIAIEACGGSNDWARKLIAMGHKVKLISPHLVIPYRRGDKNDYNDAKAIAEAAQRADMRFVPIKSVEQQDVQALHRIRERWIKSRTGLANQCRGLLLEHGIAINKGITNVRRGIPEILEDAENQLSDRFRMMLATLYEELCGLDQKIKMIKTQLESEVQQNESCQLLQSIPGIGLLSATAMYAQIGNGSEFKNGRNVGAWLGMVAKQHTTGNKPKLGSITKRGNTYLRTLLVHGARSVLRHVKDKTDKFSRWIQQLVERVGFNKACIAVAHKLSRIAWAVLNKRAAYQVNYQS